MSALHRPYHTGVAIPCLELEGTKGKTDMICRSTLMPRLHFYLGWCLIIGLCSPAFGGSPDEEFEALARAYMREFPALSPVAATALGDHRFDRELDDVSEKARLAQVEFYRQYLARIKRIDREQLTRSNRVDAELLS